MKELITAEFDKYLRDTLKTNPEVLNFLLKHERKHLCIDNLIKEIKLSELKSASSISKDVIISLSKDFAQLFAKAAVKLKAEQLMTEAAVQQKLHEAQAQKDYQDYLEDGSDAVVDSKS